MKPQYLFMRVFIASLMLLLFLSPVAAQDTPEEPVPVPPTSDDLLKLNILFVGAHPDDDSVATATMARYTLDRGARAGVITATRGEGGGNATGRQLGPSLGIVRESEERAAMRALGINHVFYLNELDWAFTTSATATEQFWGYEEPLGNLVRLFRVLKPDVVITMNPSPGSGHGHHQYAARLATEAFFLAGDPTAFPEQLEEEFIEPWQPKKLYYGLAYGGAGLQASVEIPTNEYSPSRYATYADIEAAALRLYRSQGFDSFYQVPATGRRLNPEVFMLAASMLPVPEQESDLLAGVTSGVGQAPAGVEMEVDLDEFFVSQGGQVTGEVIFRNNSNVDLSGLSLSVEAPDGFTVSEASAPVDVAVGETASAAFTVDVPDDADVSQLQTLRARFEATDASGTTVSASKPALFQVTPPVTVEFEPIEAVRIYREWTNRLDIEHLLGLAETQIAAGVGRTATLPVILTNRSNQDYDVELHVEVDNSEVALDSDDQTVTVPAGETVRVEFTGNVPEDMMPSEFAISVTAAYGDTELTNAGMLQVVPSMTVAQAAAAPTIDADLSEYASLESFAIPHTNIWEGETTDEADLTGSFSATYDDEFLYIGLEVQDDAVVSNIAPNDIKGHWRSDSVEITVDPQGAGVSEHTLTTFKVGIFPFDTEGNIQAARDADANQGVISITAPDMQMASERTENGYRMEVAIPWSAVPGEVQPGDDIGLNVLIYDCDNVNAAVGENCNEARTAWSAWGQIQGNPRLWGQATLAE